MKQMILILALFYLCTSLPVLCQTVEPDWGPTRDMEKGTYFHKIAGFDKDGYFMVRSDNILKVTNNKIYIEKQREVLESELELNKVVEILESLSNEDVKAFVSKIIPSYKRNGD